MERTNYCGELSAKDIGKKGVLCGWAHSWRNHGGVIFIDLRDRTGIIQVVVNPDKKDVFETAQKIRNEFVIKATGTTQRRLKGYENPKMKTGEIEFVADDIIIYNKTPDLPLEIEGQKNETEETRLKYRYLDLRRPRMFRNIHLRHKASIIVRNYFNSLGFLEVETPILTRSTPEGARDYLVPSRVNQGKFYALPQAPQMFKQILMVSGVDRYFQLARAFRDEDLRSDRQPEHTQIDMEMSFVNEDDVFGVIEGLMDNLFTALGEKIETPFPRYDYDTVMLKYGSDKPDLRFGMEISDATDIFKNSGFKVFSSAVENGGVIRALKAANSAALSRADMDKLTDTAKSNGAKGLVWLKFKDNGESDSPSAKFLSKEELDALKKLLEVSAGDTVFIAADKPAICASAMGAVRKDLIKKLALKPFKKWAFLWVMRFPLLEWDEEEKRYNAAHNPFTSPLKEELHLLDSNPLSMRSHQYDMVLNGTELASGSIRNHDRAVQEKILSLLGHSKEEMQQRFGLLLNALSYGAPPHGGAAVGFDRLCALLCGEESIREVIAFPKTMTAVCPLSGAPDSVSQKQLDELGIKLNLAK